MFQNDYEISITITKVLHSVMKKQKIIHKNQSTVVKEPQNCSEDQHLFLLETNFFLIFISLIMNNGVYEQVGYIFPLCTVCKQKVC